jgi:hypothetical protein
VTTDGGRAPGAFLAVALGLLSAAVLAHEVALVHLFSILHWSHFAAGARSRSP